MVAWNTWAPDNASALAALRVGVAFAATTIAGITLNSLTTTQRDALTGSAGDMVWNSTTSRVNYYDGSAWRVLSPPGGSSGQFQYNNAGAFGGANLWQGTNIVEQYNSTTAQTLRIFNTRTDASNGEWITLDWSQFANFATIGTMKNGTGSDRALRIVAGSTAIMTFGTNGWLTGAVALTATGFMACNIVQDANGPTYFCGNSNGMQVASGKRFSFSSTTAADGTADVIWTRSGPASFQHGALDAASPVAQTITFQSVSSGTSNTAGANATIRASRGTGTGAGGNIDIQVAPAGSSGTAQNSFTSAFLISNDKSATLASGTAIPAGGTTGLGYKVSSTSNFGVFFGSGAPTLSAAKGSLYLRSDGSTTNDRMYVNSDGSTTWTAVITAA